MLYCPEMREKQKWYYISYSTLPGDRVWKSDVKEWGTNSVTHSVQRNYWKSRWAGGCPLASVWLRKQLFFSWLSDYLVDKGLWLLDPLTYLNSSTWPWKTSVWASNARCEYLYSDFLGYSTLGVLESVDFRTDHLSPVWVFFCPPGKRSLQPHEELESSKVF